MVNTITFVGKDGVPFEENSKLFSDLNRAPEAAQAFASRVGLTLSQVRECLDAKVPLDGHNKLHPDFAHLAPKSNEAA